MATQRNLFLLFIIICLKIIYIKSQGNDVLDWPLPDEYNTILRTREYIANLKECGYDPEDGAGLIDPRDPEFINKDCKGKTLGELISIKDSKMSFAEKDFIQKLSVEAIKLLNKYSDISNHLEINISQRFDSLWFVFIGAKNSFDGIGKSKSKKYYHFNIGDLTIIVFSVLSSSQNVQPVEPQSIKINLNPQIIRNDFNQENTNALLSLMKASFKQESTNFNKACQIILNAVQLSFMNTVNPDQWSCASGLESKFSFIPGKGETILVAFGDIIGQITMMPQSALRIPYDVIVETRENINNVNINQTFMNRSVRDSFVQITKNAILQGDDYKVISDQIKKASELAFGKSWTALVGLDTQFWTHFSFRRPLLMNLKIGELRVIAYAH